MSLFHACRCALLHVIRNIVDQRNRTYSKSRNCRIIPTIDRPFPRCVATLMARMGQCFSTSTDTITVVPEETGIEFKDIEDVEIAAADQKYTFSDGVGRISSNVAKKVSTEVGRTLFILDKSISPKLMFLVSGPAYEPSLLVFLQEETN